MSHRFQKEFAELLKAIRGSFDSVVKRAHIERNLGKAEIKKQDVPEDWSKSDREHLIWRARLFAKLTDDEFEDILKSCSRQKERFSIMMVRDKADNMLNEKRKAKRVLKTITAQGIDVYQGDICKLRAIHSKKPAAAIICDPPYEKIALPLWEELAKFAGAEGVLRDHGWLVAMSGQTGLPDVLHQFDAAAKKNGLYYRWTIAMHMPGGQAAQGWIDTRNPVNVQWKPIFVYSKGKPQSWPEELSDYIVSTGNENGASKASIAAGLDTHKWGQNLDTCLTLVEKFSPPGGLVVTPFLGSGTLAVAAKRLGRAFEGFDLYEENVIATTNRLAAEEK